MVGICQTVINVTNATVEISAVNVGEHIYGMVDRSQPLNASDVFITVRCQSSPIILAIARLTTNSEVIGMKVNITVAQAWKVSCFNLVQHSASLFQSVRVSIDANCSAISVNTCIISGIAIVESIFQLQEAYIAINSTNSGEATVVGVLPQILSSENMKASSLYIDIRTKSTSPLNEVAVGGVFRISRKCNLTSVYTNLVCDVHAQKAQVGGIAGQQGANYTLIKIQTNISIVFDGVEEGYVGGVQGNCNINIVQNSSANFVLIDFSLIQKNTNSTLSAGGYAGYMSFVDVNRSVVLVDINVAGGALLIGGLAGNSIQPTYQQGHVRGSISVGNQTYNPQ